MCLLFFNLDMLPWFRCSLHSHSLGQAMEVEVDTTIEVVAVVGTAVEEEVAVMVEEVVVMGVSRVLVYICLCLIVGERFMRIVRSRVTCAYFEFGVIDVTKGYSKGNNFCIFCDN